MEPVFTTEDCRFFRELILLQAPASLVSARRQSDPKRQRPSAGECSSTKKSWQKPAECQRLADCHGMRLHLLNATDPALEERFLHLLAEG